MSMKGFAQTRNMLLGSEVALRLMNRRKGHGTPGLGVIRGPAGHGKSTVAMHVNATTQGSIFITCNERMTANYFLAKILKEFDEEKSHSMNENLDRVIDALNYSECPLLVLDEADKMVVAGFVEMVRNIYDMTGVPVLLVGEEKLRTNLMKEARTQSRVLVSQSILPANDEDARKLIDLYSEDVILSDDLVSYVNNLQSVEGSARELIAWLDMITEHARENGLNEVDLKTWQSWAPNVTKRIA